MVASLAMDTNAPLPVKWPETLRVMTTKRNKAHDNVNRVHNMQRRCETGQFINDNLIS